MAFGTMSLNSRTGVTTACLLMGTLKSETLDNTFKSIEAWYKIDPSNLKSIASESY